MVHSISRLVSGVNWVLITKLLGPLSLLIHVGSTHQLGCKVPALTLRQLYVHSQIVISLLQMKSSL